MESFKNLYWQRTWDKFHLEYLKQLLYMKYFFTWYIISNVSNIIIPENQNKCLS